MIQMLNPKVALFFVAYFPQFVTAESAAIPHFALLGAIYLLIACASDSVYVLLASSAGRRFARRAPARRRAARLSAATYIGLGAFAALAGHRSAAAPQPG